uniref:nesprin-2 isoform X2 n=1 Tax=Gasterosteus aculeatus aculeatus TaxID=481459 RepID=UPI001A98FB3B|nr:nesprin-2 isoform X2 [Gasterosteus aculeatus aculeatus]
MASGGAEEGDGGIPLDIDNVHMLLQVEQEQIQKRTFTNWINAQLAKRCPPSFVSDLFTDLREGSQLLDLLEVMSSQPMKRQRGRGVFQQRANVETALNFLKKKSIKLVNINIPDIIDGRPSIILGLIWTVILHCHIEELASTLSYSSCHSSLDSLATLDSWSGSPVPSGRTSPLHRRFRLSAKKALLMWVRDQCLKVGCSVSVKNFKSSWRSGEAFLAILGSLRPQLADLSLVQVRSNLENLEEAFHLAERELHIPRLLEPEDVDVKDPDEKSIMTYVAQFLQYSNDMPAPNDHLQVFSTERALEVTSWLQRAYQELSEARAAAENSSFAEKYHVLHSLAGCFTEQRRPVMTLLAAIRRCPELSREQCALRTAWDCLEKELQRCKVDLDSSLPPPLDSVVVWLQRAEASLTEEGGRSKDHADAAKEARARQDAQQTLMKEMSYFVNIIATFHNTDDLGNTVVPIEKFNEIKRSLTNIRVTAKYEGIKLEYQETRHTVLHLLGRLNAKVVTWKSPYGSQETVLLLLQDWHETVERHGMLLILMDALKSLKEKANTYTSKAALGEDAQLVTRQLKESESQAELVTRTVAAARGTMERAACVWETYNKCLASLQTWLAQNTLPHVAHPPAGTQDMREWTSCQARLNEAGNALIEVTESSAGLAVAKQLSEVNRKWAEHVKRTKFAVSSEPSVGPWCLKMVHLLSQEASRLLRMPLEVSSVSLKANRQKLQLLSKKMAEVDLSSLGPSQSFQTSDTENLQQHLPKVLADAESACEELQRAASGLEGRLAELDHWSTEAMDRYQHPRDKRHSGRSAFESAAKVLICRGVQLEKQVITEGQDLQDLVARVQKTSPLVHLSTCGMQDRISEAVSHCQEILEMFGSLGFLRHVKSAHQTRRQPEAGLFVVAKTKQVEQIGNVLLTQDPSLVSPELSSQTLRQIALHGWATNQHESTTVNPCVETQMLPGPLREPILHIHSPLTRSIQETEPEHVIQPRTLSKRRTQASSWSHNLVLPALIQTPFGLKCQNTPVLSKHVTSPVPEEEKRSPPSQTCTSESRMIRQLHSVQSVKTSPKPPVVVRGEVHSKAQSMARSRLEKARFRLQGRIQKAIKLFGGKEVSESQVKRKQRVLKILQPVFMDEFLGAVEGLGAFCTGPQLQDLMLLSDSVRRLWEEVGREMAAFVPILWCKIREGKQSSSVVKRETQTNALHEAHEQTDHDSLPQQQAVTEGAASVEVESLEELCATLTSRESSCLATDQLKESDEDQETHPNDTELPSARRGWQIQGPPPLRATGESADTQQSNSFPQEACLWQNQAHIQVVVRGNAVETKQEAEWTVLPGSAALAQEEQTSGQDVLRRVTSLEITADLMALVTERLDRLIRESVDVSSFTLADPRLVSDLKEMNDALRSEMRRLSERASEEGMQSPPSRCQALHKARVHHLQLLIQRLEEVLTAAQALDHFMATVREVKAEIPTLVANQPPGRQPLEAEWEQETDSWQATMQRKLLTVDSVDSSLKAAGMTLTMDGARVTCWDVLTSLSQQAVNVEEEVGRGNKRERKDDFYTAGREKIQAFNPMEEEGGLVAKRSKPERDDDRISQRHAEHEAQTRKLDENDLTGEERRGRSIQVKKEGEETESSVQRRVALSGTLKAIREAAEQLRLQEPTLPALQHRTRALAELHSRLTELQHAQDTASQSENQNVSPPRELEDAWEEATKAVTDRLEQCDALTELLKRFQSIRGELSGTLQRAESTVREQASYMGKDNLQRLHTKVQETKSELSGLADGIEEVRSVCRQLHTHLRQLPGCLSIPFEDETEAVMDRWLDVSEKTDSYLENLHRGLTLWDGVIQLGAAVQSWTSNKLVVAQCPSFQTEEDIRALQSEIVTREENMERFHRRVAEIQALLQSREPPLELQVVETQIRKKMKQLKELVSEAEDVYRQKEAAEEQITARMAECFNSLQKIQDSLLTLSASDVPTVLAKLKGLLFELQTRDEQAESLLQDLRVMASTAGPGSLHSSSVDGTRLQDEVRNTHQLFSEVEEQTERNIRALDRLQSEGEHLEQWLQSVEGKAAKDEDLAGLLQEEPLKQSVRTAALDQLTLQSSTCRQSALLEESSELLKQHHNFKTRVLSAEKQSSVSRDVEACQTLSKSTQSPVGHHRQTPDSPLGENLVRSAQAAVIEMAEGKSHLEDLGVPGNPLSDGTGLKQDFQGSLQGSMQKSEAPRTDFLQPGQSCHNVLQVDPDLTRTAQLPTLFPGSGLSERKQVCCLGSHGQDEAESLQLTFTRPAEQTSEKDPFMAELETRCSSLMDELKGVCSSLQQGVCNEEHFGKSLQACRHKLTSLQEKMSACRSQKESSAKPITDAPALQALLREVTGIEKELLQIITLKNSSSAKDQDSLSEPVGSPQNHKRALDSSIRGGRSPLTDKNKQRVQREEGEVTCLQTDLKEMSENPCGNSVSPDLTQLQQQWDSLQDCDTRRTELGARVCDLQQAGESGSAREIPPADVTVSAVAEDLDRLSSIHPKKKQACAEHKADVGSEDINQRQPWRQTVQADLSSPSQASLDEGLCLQQGLCEILTEKLTEISETTTALVSSRSSERDQKDNKYTTNETMETTKEQKLTTALPKINVKNFFVPNDDTRTMDTDGNPLRRGLRELPGHNTLMSDSLPTLKTGSVALQETTTEIASQRLSAQQETFETVPDAQEQDKHCEDACVTPHKVLTIVLYLERPQLQLQDIVGACSPGVLTSSQRAKVCDAQLTKSSSVPEKKSEGFTTLPGPESDETDLVIHYTTNAALNESPVANSLPRNPLALAASEFEDINPTNATLLCRATSESQASMHSEVFNSSNSFGTDAKCQLTCAHAAETTSLDVRREETTHFCHAEEQTMSFVSCTGEADAWNATQRPAGDNKQLAASTGQLVRAEGGSPESLQSQLSKGPKRVKATLPLGGSEREMSTSLEDRQRQTRDSMEPERTAPDPPAGEATGGSPEYHERRSTMHSVLPAIQSLVESSKIINRTPQIDFNWHLKYFPGESQVRLVRAVQNVLACRYQPAQLDVSAMAKQLQEAKDCRRCVQEQVATMKSMSGARICDPDGLKRAEGQWSAALLEASATVQVKAAQLDQVKEYHKRMKITRAFLEVVAAEKDKMSLSTLRSSALQADKLQALLQAMVQKKDTMEELLQLSRRFSVHLSDAESSGALLAQLGDVQEEWRLLEGSIKRALQHASSSTSQYSLLIREAEQLKAKLDALRPSSFKSRDSKSALELVCLSTDVQLYNQLYMHLQSQTDALIHFPLGQKEKDELSGSLKDLRSLLHVTKSQLDTSNYICGGISSTKINKQLQDLIIWAKQAENHISVSNKSALFPEEARVQIVQMKKFQTDIWFRSSKMQTVVENMKAATVSDMENEQSDKVLKTIEDLYEAFPDRLNQVLDTMKDNLQERETLLCQFASIDEWLAEMRAQRDPCALVDNVSKADIGELESELKSHQLAAVEIEAQLNRVDAMADACREIAVCSSPGESRYLVNRLSGLWTELHGLLAHEKALSWELEELIHELTTSGEELSAIQASLKQISTDLVQQRFPLTQETLSAIAHLKHTLMEHQCQVRGLKQFQEARRSSVLCTIGELQDQCKALSINAVEQDKYLHLRRQMVESRDIVEEQIQRAKDETISVGERVMLCQSLLVELPLVKTQCQEVADQLETIAQELEPSDLHLEKERIHCTVEALVSWEDSVTDDIKNLEAKLLLGLHFFSEHRALIELFQRTRVEMEGLEPVTPDEKAIDIALTRNLIICRHMESGMRVLEGLGRKENVDLKNYKELYSLRDATMRDCHLRMESLCQARESLKDYHWAAQGAMCFLHNAEATFLSAPGGFLDCTEEQTQTQQALEALEGGFQAHICHLVDLVPSQTCLSRPKTEQLHIGILSQLLVGRAILEAQAQLRMESLRSCEVRQQSHRKWHEDIRQRLSGFEIKLSECATEQVTSSDQSIAQQKRATLLLEGLLSLAGQLDELRAGCPAQSCGVGKDGELGALWRRWVSLRRGVGIVIAHTEQRGEEWKDITTSMEQCCSSLVRLQSEVPDSSAVSFSQEELLELLQQAEMHRAWLEQEQQALSSLEHRLERALGLSSTQEPASPGPVAKTLVKLQDQVRSLKERNLLVVAAAQAEDKERQQVQVEIAEWEQNMLTILPSLEACSNPCKQQELRQDLSSQKDKLKCIMDGVQDLYAEIPAGISRRLQEAQRSLQREEEKLVEKSNLLRRLDSQVAELGSGLEIVKVLLEQRSPTVNEAQNAIKLVWDELDAWHSRLMLLDSEVQDLAEEHPDQAHLLMDQLNRPLQLYQNAAHMTEQRTAFLSKVPACLQEFEDIMHGAACWLDEAQSWLSDPCSFPTARGLQNHANSLQLVLDDSERIRQTLQAFRPVLDEISAVCDISTHEERVNQKDQQVQKMQRKILQPLEQILPAVGVVETLEAELKTMEQNVPKIRAILSSVDDTHITLMEHLQNRQVIVANVQSMQRTLEEIERCKGELHLPQGAEESLLVFSRARLLLQPLDELQQLTHQQAALLQNKIRAEKEEWNDLDIIAVSGSPEEVFHLDRAPQKCIVQQEAFELSNSEEEEEDENNSCHSSSSDTLTCSIPEDPEETLSASDVQKEEIAKIKQPPDVTALESLAGAFTSEVKTSSKSVPKVPGLLPGSPRTSEPESENVATGLIKTDSVVGEAFGHETVTIEPPIAAASLAVEDKFTAGAAKLDSHGSPKCESLVAEPHATFPQAAAAVEETRLIPARPETPFTATRGFDGFMEEADKHPYFSTRPHRHLNSPDVSTVRGEESPRAREMSEEPISMAEQGEDNEGELRWIQLNTQILQKLITLKKVKEGHQKDPERELTSPGSASAVLLRAHESITMMRQIVSSPGANDTLYAAARKLLLCLDALTDLLLTPGEDAQLRLLQQECVSTELVTLCEMLSKVASAAAPALLREKPEALRCLVSLQECLQMGRLVSTSSHNQLIEYRGHALRLKEHGSSQLCNLDEFEIELSEMFPNIMDVSILEQCMQGRHQRESPGVKANLQQVSRSLLRGITNLVELGEECVTEEQMSRTHNCSQFQAIRCRYRKLLGVLGSQLAFVQHLFQREPGALACQEAERVQLEVRANVLQQQAVQQEVAYERRIEEWTRWEDNSGQLGELLDDLEAFISSGEPEGDNGSSAQHRQAACQQALVRLDDSRAALGLLLDQRKVLQADPEFAAKVGQAGGALELRWLSTRRRTEQESRRCRDIQDSQDRFQTDFSSVSEWLAGAEKHRKSWTNLANASDLKQECICANLIKLLDFSMEIEAMSVQRASASREATKLLRLREADCPELRAQLAQLECSWTQLTSDLSTIQDSLQQLLAAAGPPVELLSHLEAWRKKLEDRLSLEKGTLVKAEDAAQITEHLQHYQELKAGALNALLLLDFLCQSGPQPGGPDVRALRSERTVCAEQLGALRLQWLHLQGELECQSREAEQTHYTCADRERRLQRLHSWIEQQKKHLNQWKQPISQTAAREAMLELEAAVSKVKEGCAALQELKSIRVANEEDRPCDVSFSGWTESVCRAYVELSQQMEVLQPALQLNVGEWSCYERDLKEVSIHTTRVHCALQHQPLYSLKQAEGHQDLLQQLQDKVREGERLWASVDKSYQGLVKNVHPATAQELDDQMRAERKRWEDVVQELKNEHMRNEETICLWLGCTQLSDRCSLDLLTLWRQWEELWRSSPRETQDMVHSVEKLQNAAQDLQSSAGDVLGAFKPLIERLEPLATNVIKSEARQLSRDVLLLIEAMSAKKKSLQEALEQQEIFRTLLEALEKQTQRPQHLTRFNNTDEIKQALSELIDLFPSLVDVREMSCYVILTNHETERLHMLSRQWVESMTHASDINRELQAERQCSQNLQEKCKSLAAIQKKIEEESMSKKCQSISSLRDMMTAHKRLEAEIIIGNQLVQGLLCHAVESMETEGGEKSSELMAHVDRVRESWLDSLALAGQRRSSTKEQLGYWRVYQRGSTLLSRLLREGDPLLSSAGPAVFAAHQLPSCTDDDQRVKDALGLHASVFTRTLGAGRHLCETMTESECQSQLQSELQALQDAWERTTSLLERRRDGLSTAVQKWTECQDTISSITSELEELKSRLKQPLPEEELQDFKGEKHVQEIDLLLKHFTGEFRELATMKTEMSQYVAAGDSALLEQQLEQLHSQWEELCSKVSSRRREIADRLNAWTIFSDKNKEFCAWLTQMENKVCHSGELSIEEMVEKLKKDCMEEINLFSENKSHLKQLGEQLLLASDEAKRTQVNGSLQEVNQRWHNLFHQIEARVKKLKETLVAVQQLDKNMSNLRSWLSRIEAELSRPITYSVCHLQEIQRRLEEQQVLQRDIEQHTEGVASVLSLCDVLLRDGEAACGIEVESDSLQETSNSLDQRWRAVCAIALDRRLRIEETWRLWCKFLDDYSRFEDWLKMAERTAANPNSADVLYTVAKEELKKFENFQRQVHERLTQLELVNNQYRRLARENRTDRASQLKAMVHEGNRRWDELHRRVSAVLRRLKYFTGQREEFEGTRESMLVWLTELDLQLTNVEHFSESDVHHKIQQLNSFQKEITVNTERIDGLIVFGEGLIQKSTLQDAALIEDELEELHSYCQEVFSRLVRFHQRLSQPPMIREEPALSGAAVSLESNLELICRPWLMRSHGSLPATPTRLLASPLERSGRETPVSVDSLPLEWDHTGDVGGSSSHEDEEEEEEEEEQEDDRTYFSAPSVLSTSVAEHEPPRWRCQGDTEAQLDSDRPSEAPQALTSTPLKQGYLLLMSDCSGSIEDIKRVSLILDDEEQPEDLGLTGLCAADKQSGVIERWELLQAQSRSPQEACHLPSALSDITSWLEKVTPELKRLQQLEPAASIEDMASSATKLKEMQRTFTHYKSIMLSVNLRAQEAAELEEGLAGMNRDWGRACAGLQQWESRLRETLTRCKEFHERLHSLLLWLAHAESRRYAADISDPATPATDLRQHLSTLTDLQRELRGRQTQQASLQALWSQLQPEDEAEEAGEAEEKLHVTSSKLKWLLREVEQDLGALQRRLDGDAGSNIQGQNTSAHPKKGSCTQREKRDSPPPRSFFYRVLRAAFPLHLLLVFLLLLPCLIPVSESEAGCTGANNFARSFYPMLRYTNGPPPT